MTADDRDLDDVLLDGDILITGQAENPYVDHIPRWCPSCRAGDGSVPCGWPRPDAPLRTRRRMATATEAARQRLAEAPCTRCGGPVEIYPFFVELLELSRAQRIERYPPVSSDGRGPSGG